MPILFVNGKRRGLRIRGSASLGKRNPAKRRARKGKMPPALARYWAKRRGKARKNPARRRSPRSRSVARARAGGRRVWDRGGGWAAIAKERRDRGETVSPALRALAASEARRKKSSRKRGRRARRSNAMAKGSRKRAKAMRAYWRKRKAAGKKGGLGRTKRARRRRSSAAPKRRRGRARKVSHKRRRSRRSRRTRTRRTRMSKKIRGHRRRARRARGTRRRSRRSSMRTMLGPGGGAVTVKMNPGRRRRRRRTHGRRRARRVHRRSYRRYRRGYRRNPGGMLIDLAKKAVPVLLSFYGSRLIVNKIGPMLPGVSSLGSLQGPALSIGAVLLANFATKKVGALASHREEIMLGTAFSALDAIFRAFAPASVQSMIGMSDYVAMSDYIAVGATPLHENFTLSDYIAVGSDGVSEELGLEEELGVEEELGGAMGNPLLGGMPGGASLLKPVPPQAFIAPVPARSFTKQIPSATTSYDAAADVYGGIFGGRFGG